MITVIVDGEKVALVPLWMSRHVIDDAPRAGRDYPGSTIVLEVKEV